MRNLEHRLFKSLGLGDPGLGLGDTFVGVVVEKTQSQLNGSVLTGGYKEMSSILADPQLPRK